ncbi:MAG: EAL domain-containing protein, partial [Gemmatimonadaceae bacterium]
MSAALLLTDGDDAAIAAAAKQLPGYELAHRPSADLVAEMDKLPGARVLLLASDDPSVIRAAVEGARLRHLPVVMACRDDVARRRALEHRVEEWYQLPASAEEIVARVRSAIARAASLSAVLSERVEKVELEEMLYDALTGLPTLPVMIERMRPMIKARGELIVFYLNFVRYSKLEEIYGWEKLDGVLETTASAVREFLDENAFRSTRMMVSFTNDDDFIFFHIPATGAAAATDTEIIELARGLQQHIGRRLEETQGDDIAALFDIYVGYAHVYYNPKIRLERLIYRAIREAANAAKSVEERERARKVADLKQLLHDGGVYVDYHPIVATDTNEIMGFEALARGVRRSLRSPEVMFEVAAEADLVWELSRLCRQRALEGAARRLAKDQLLFLNVDPHDFADPAFGDLGNVDPKCVVIEITERTAIKDYPKFRERLKAFRDKGYRFAVDDAGSGYAGLGSIANLEPDFIKLDISL